jgi:hypothetical protein
MLDKMMRHMNRRDMQKRIVGIACVCIVVALLVYEVFYIRIYDAAKFSRFPVKITEAAVQTMKTLETVPSSRQMDIVIDGKAVVRVNVGTDILFSSLETDFSARIATGQCVRYTLGDDVAMVVSRWAYEHRNGLYNTIFRQAKGKQQFYMIFPTAEERRDKPYYRYYTNICFQRGSVRYNMDVFCKKTELLDDVLNFVVTQINTQG